MKKDTIARAGRAALRCAVLALALAALAAPGRAQTSIDYLGRVNPDGTIARDNVTVGLDGKLAVVLKLDANTVVDPTKATLYLDGRAVTGLADTVYRANETALVFHLLRNDENAAAWQPLLAAASFTPRTVEVGLVLGTPAPGAALIVQADHTQPTFKLVLLSPRWMVAALAAVLVVILVVLFCAKRTNILRDAMLPQLAPRDQPFSLGRTQMAFWLAVVFSSFWYLFVLLVDYNTLTSQALMLMGVSGATAAFAVAIDANKDTPIGAANDTLRAIGLHTYQDVLQLDQEIAERQAMLQKAPASAVDATRKLQTEIFDRQNRKRTWRELTLPYVSQGWWHDLTTDINGPALHRLQMVAWTLAFGMLFLLDVYRTLSMPPFSQLQLSLMGITSAGYLGFKYPEVQH